MKNIIKGFEVLLLTVLLSVSLISCGGGCGGGEDGQINTTLVANAAADQNVKTNAQSLY